MDQAPEAHCWKLLPPTQLKVPVVVQGPVWAPAAEPEAGAGEAGTDGAAEGATGAIEGAEEATGVMEGMAVPEMVTAVGAAGAGAGAGVGTVGGGIAPPADAAGAGAAGAGAGAWVPEQPVGGAVFWPGVAPAYWTYLPGSGKARSADSLVPQPPPTAPTLATNMGGKAARLLSEKPGAWEGASMPRGAMGSASASRFLEAPVTVTGAQFMYISLLPILLNQVHARVYSPGAMPSGMENSNLLAPELLGSLPRLPGAPAGQPPMME